MWRSTKATSTSHIHGFFASFASRGIGGHPSIGCKRRSRRFRPIRCRLHGSARGRAGQPQVRLADDKWLTGDGARGGRPVAHGCVSGGDNGLIGMKEEARAAVGEPTDVCIHGAEETALLRYERFVKA